MVKNLPRVLEFQAKAWFINNLSSQIYTYTANTFRAKMKDI